MTFAVRLLHYYTFYSIYRLQRGTSAGISWKAGQGVRPINRAPIPPPDAVPYSNNDLLKLVSVSEFLRDSDKMLWRFDNNRLVVPEGTAVSFVEIPADPSKGQMMICRIRFERPHYYTVDFDISPGLAQLGQMPAGFVPQQKYRGLSLGRCKSRCVIRLKSGRTIGFRPEQYSAWADGLFDGLKKKMEF